ncbi:hypothetical protein SAMN04488544_3310 [Microlunatus sagamiharensis]|uniref:Uncharacterized protein n=1 Tax=Microlunatus sagamiharensis TaxID=546874 RepID=A0A1H2N4V3_9ACTN|nr:hypothetical protein [Microlunatus sagamiharensis]SDV00392.1 hypothetical protein SAMN04488544_3310 [Microlunatus sagamiharensis]
MATVFIHTPRAVLELTVTGRALGKIMNQVSLLQRPDFRGVWVTPEITELDDRTSYWVPAGTVLEVIDDTDEQAAAELRAEQEEIFKS